MAEIKRRLVLLYQGGKEGRGAWFDIAHKAAVTEAARQPNHVVIELDQAQLDQAQLDQINPDIPAGTLTGDGRPHPLPVMLGVTFQRLVELAKAQAAKPGAAATAVAPAAAAPVKSQIPAPWSEIVVGSIVLASNDKDDGWWECVVTGLEGVGLGWAGLFLSFLCIVLGAVAMTAKGRLPGILLIVSSILAALFGGTIVAICMVLGVAGGILAAIPGRERGAVTVISAGAVDTTRGGAT